ncbi:MAG TPA: imidazole glycerol phosphate synthase subunit HisH [Thermoanaerobaculia bacterium]|nr:imidazole glycerol phosphate synthase subunit HisH [Thermoanaerobaculia bacterium]
MAPHVILSREDGEGSPGERGEILRFAQDDTAAVTLIDSPVANTANIARALLAAGASLVVTADPLAVARASKLVLPGVGSFAAAMRWLRESRIDAAMRGALARGASLLGICVGHQLLFDASSEMGSTPGLGLLRGEVRKLEGSLPVPQIGWNRVRFNGAPLFRGIADGTPFYFVHSYAASGVASEVAAASYGAPFTAAVQQDRVFGVQFHPEKSSNAGLQVLRNFVAWR